MAIIGIDLGTSNSLVCVWSDTGAELVPNGLGEVLTPSAISIDDDGSLLVGQAARDRLITAPGKTASEFKRFMGTDKVYTLGERRLLPEELSSFVLRKLKEDAEAHLAKTRPGEEITEAIVSVPAYFNDNQRAATKRAGLLAGLKVDRLLNEPSAAALACRLYDLHTDYTALVFDFGGGTLDISIVDCFDNMISVLTVAGDNRLGGADFDRQIAHEFCIANHLFFEQLSPTAKASLLFQAEQAKKQLTENDSTTISIDHEGISGNMELTNQKLVDICAPLFARMAVPVRRALADSKKHLNSIGRVIMVGGSCKMPVVQEYLRQLFGRELEHPFSPDTVIGLGAGVYAGIRERKEQVRDIIMTDLCPFTLGTSVKAATDSGPLRFSPIIERNSALPCSKTSRFHTASHLQQSVRVDVYQGEERHCQDNLLLGSFSIEVPPAPKGEECIDVRFTYDINGILEVEVTVVSTGETHREIIIGKGNSLSSEEIATRLAALSKLKIQSQHMEEARALVAHAERLYTQSTGDVRLLVGEALDQFQITVEKGIPTTIARETPPFKKLLTTLEQKILGYGLFPSDNQDDEYPFPEETPETESDDNGPTGNSSGAPIQ